ncbi:3-ketoacyl-ACP reductase [Achromatium sp. WMS1]|nr:3-ketoacyl-ACP reductase [Achromatium sp. WMS1]
MVQKVALITGGIGGIGTAICQRLAKDGLRVVASYYPPLKDEAKAWQLAQAAEGLEIGIIAGDVSSAQDSTRMVSEIESQYGIVQILVNCAGVTRDRTFRKMPVEDWDTVINTNLNSVFYVTQPIWNKMLQQGFGRIINISSVNGQRGQFGQANYSAAKAGMHGFTMALAQEGAAKGITVNTVSPGYTETPMTLAMRDDVRDAIIASIPMKRMGRPEEIASVIAFLIAEENGYITGANIPVNGGLFMH